MFSKLANVVRRHRKLFIGASSVVLAITLIVSGLQLQWIPVPQHGGIFQIGKGEVVLTIGTAEAATVTDYTCDGVADDEQFDLAIDALPSTGGKLEVLGGNYTFTATVSRAINNVTIEGVGKATYFSNNASAAIFSAGSQTNWVFKDFSTDAGGLNVTLATYWTQQNITIGSTYYAFRASNDSDLGASTSPWRTIYGEDGDFSDDLVVDDTAIIATGNITTLYQNNFLVPTAGGSPDYVVGVNTATDDVPGSTGYWVKNGSNGQVVRSTSDATDALDDIQYALDTAGVSGGGTVELTTGTFYVSVGLVNFVLINYSNIWFRGQGTSSILYANASSENQIICVASNAVSPVVENITVSDMQITGVYTNNSALDANVVAVSVGQNSPYIVRNIRITGLYIHDIKSFPGIGGGKGIDLMSNWSGGCSNILIDNNIVERTDQSGIAMIHTDGVGAANNIIIAHNRVTNGGMDDGGDGINVRYAQGVSVNSNTVVSSNGSGINISYSSTGISVVGNTSNNNTGHGILVGGDSSQVTVTGNSCRYNTLDGFNTSGSYVTATANEFNFNGNDGAHLGAATNVALVANNIYSNTQWGVHVYHSDSRDEGIIGNTIVSNGSGGIYLEAGSRYTVQGNTIVDNTNYQILYSAAVSNVSITGNSIKRTAGNCIQGDAVSTNITVTANTLDIGGLHWTVVSSAKIRNNAGFVNANSGAFTIETGTWGTSITHGLYDTPTRIFLSLSGNTTTTVYSTSAGATTFSANISSLQSANVTGNWMATYGESS